MSQGLRKKQPSTSPGRGKAVERRGWRAPRRSVMMILAIGLLAAVSGPYWAALIPDLLQRPEYQFPMTEIRATPLNDWVPRNLIAQLIEQGELPESVSLLDPDAARIVGQALENHAWIRRVETIRITGALELQAFLEYRRPVLFVDLNGTLVPVDTDGVVLPPRDFSRDDVPRLPHLRNIQSAPPGAGQPWPDPAVQAAALLANALCPENDMSRHWNRYGIVALVARPPAAVPALPDLLEFELQLSNGLVVIWGHAPGFDSLEPSVDQKLARLESLHQRGLTHSSVDATTPRWFDVRLMEYGAVDAGVQR